MIFLTRMQIRGLLSMKVTCEFRSMNIVEKVSFKTEGYQFINITEKIQELVILHEFKKGLVNLSILHTSASLLIQENADPSVLVDLVTFYSKLVPSNVTKADINPL